MQRRHYLPLVSSVLLGGALLSGRALLGAVPVPPGSPAIAGLPPSAAVWTPVRTPSGPIRGVPVRNFGVVTPGALYRSAQPGPEDYPWLAKQGFKGIVCLRSEYDNGAERMKSYGLNYLHLAIPDHHAPTDEQGLEFLKFVRNPENWPVLIHCKQGIGRTGVLAALSRYAIDGWSMSDALREARNYRPFGFRVFGDQRRWLNHWKDRFPAGQYRLAGAGRPARIAQP